MILYELLSALLLTGVILAMPSRDTWDFHDVQYTSHSENLCGG
jgi:hypothetical protein